MTLRFQKTVLRQGNLAGNAFYFGPSTPPKALGIFTHGFTSHKNTLLPWATRLSEKDMGAVIFDLPGHYLGGFHEVESFEEFTEGAPHLFHRALDFAQEILGPSPLPLFLGGHSLGALLSLKSLSAETYPWEPSGLALVGFGLNPPGLVHVFDTPLFQKTMEIRNALVSKHLQGDVMFPWVKDQKNEILVKGQRILILTGKDDVVVHQKSTQELTDKLQEAGNVVTLEVPDRLSHHQPEMAARHIEKFIQEVLAK